MTDTTGFAELRKITKRLATIDGERDQLRARATELVVDELKKGTPPTEVADASPFSSAHVRTLARVAGLPPAKRGKKPGKPQD